MEYELRTNRIVEGHVDDVLNAWLEGVVPLGRRFGFRFEGAWLAEGAGEMVWVLGYDGPDGFDAADERYYASTERASLDPDPAQWSRPRRPYACAGSFPRIEAGERATRRARASSAVIS